MAERRRLPTLKRREVTALLNEFAPDHRREGDIVVGRGRDGKSFSIHLGHGGGARPDVLNRVLRYLGVSREEFDKWHRGR